MTSKDKNFIRDNYVLAVETKGAWNDIPIEIYRARCISDLPKELIEHIVSTNSNPERYTVERHNADYGYFDAIYILEIRVKDGFMSKTTAYVSAILRRPFTAEQQKHYEEIMQKKDRLHHMWDSKNEE